MLLEKLLMQITSFIQFKILNSFHAKMPMLNSKFETYPIRLNKSVFHHQNSFLVSKFKMSISSLFIFPIKRSWTNHLALLPLIQLFIEIIHPLQSSSWSIFTYDFSQNCWIKTTNLMKLYCFMI